MIAAGSGMDCCSISTPDISDLFLRWRQDPCFDARDCHGVDRHTLDSVCNDKEKEGK